jgi:cobalamin biosynthesis protein CobW
VALGIGAAAEDSIDSRRSHHDGEADHDHDDFESFVVRFGPVADPAQVEQRVKAAARDFDVLRVKGFLDVEARDMRHVLQAVGPRVERYYDRPWKKADVRGSQLVVIGERGLDRAAIESLLKG